MAEVNRQFVLAHRPEGMPRESDWKLVESPVPEPGEGEIVARANWLSVDPYMRSRLGTTRNYAKNVEIGEVMQGGGVGRVVRSRHPDFKPGDVVESMAWGWQDYATLPPARTRKVDLKHGPMRYALGLLGMPGLTAYFAFFDVGRPRAGETVVVSAASGAVGQVVGQMAKLNGCRAVAVAGDDKKLDFCRRELGYDAAISHRSDDLPAALKAACPNGIDIYFDNTAGPIADAVMPLTNVRARVIQCGVIAIANKVGQPDMGLRFHRQFIVSRMRMEGFLVTDYLNRYDEGLAWLGRHVREGKLKYREDIAEGLEIMPKAFLRLLTGENFGKQLVKVAPEPS
jgi:NADPH-dependent curcumin reductase